MLRQAAQKFHQADYGILPTEMTRIGYGQLRSVGNIYSVHNNLPYAEPLALLVQAARAKPATLGR
jgi:hypothetical protein